MFGYGSPMAHPTKPKSRDLDMGTWGFIEEDITGKPSRLDGFDIVLHRQHLPPEKVRVGQFKMARGKNRKSSGQPMWTARIMPDIENITVTGEP